MLDFDLGDDIAPGDPRNLEVRPVRDADAFTLGDDAQPGTAYLMTPAGDIVDIGFEARWNDPFVIPTAARATPDGTVVAFVDFASSDLETALISLPDLEVTFLDGGLATLSNERVRTTTRRDTDGFEVETFDLSGDRIESFEVDPFRLGIDAANGDLITLVDEGEIVRWSTEGDSDRLAEFETRDGRDFVPMTRTDGRDPALAVAALDGEVLIVGPDGEVLGGIELDTPVSRFELGGRCLPVVTETGVAIIEVASGEILAEENIGRDRLPFVVRSADDACVVFATGDEDVLFGADATAGFGPREALAGLSEDGSAYAVRDADGVIEVRTVGTVPGAAIELDVGASSSIHFLRR